MAEPGFSAAIHVTWVYETSHFELQFRMCSQLRKATAVGQKSERAWTIQTQFNQVVQWIKAHFERHQNYVYQSDAIPKLVLHLRKPPLSRREHRCQSTLVSIMQQSGKGHRE